MSEINNLLEDFEKECGKLTDIILISKNGIRRLILEDKEIKYIG